MAGGDDRIDVVVTDGIDPNVDKKLRAIADSADRGQASVLKLKAELASMNETSITKLQAATQTSTTSLNKQLSAQQALTKATQASAAADIATASNKSKVAQAIGNQISQEERLASVVDRAIQREAERNKATQAALAAGGSLPPINGGRAIGVSAEADAAAIAASANTMKAAVADAEVASVGSFGRIKTAAMGAFDFIRDALLFNAGKFKGFFGSGGISTMESEAAEVTKVGSTVKTNSRAITESLVLVREGLRGNFTRMAGSASILAGALGVLRLAIPAAIAGVAAFGLAKFTLNTQTEQNSLTKYAQSLGLTEKEMRKLKDTTVDASGKLKEHNDLQITFGDVMHGVIKTIEQGISALGDYLDTSSAEIRGYTVNAIDFITQFFANAVGEIFAFGKFVYTEVVNLFTLAHDVGVVVGNTIYLLYATIANGVIALFNGVATVANAASNAVGHGDLIKKMDYLHESIGDIGHGLKGFKGEDFFGDVRNGAAATNKVLAQTANNIRGAARERVKAEADAIKANRNPTKQHDPKTRQDYLNDTNKKLDDELSRMHLLKDAREEQQRLDQIEEEFAKRRQPLTQKEIDGFRAKIKAIQDYKYVQSEMDRIYDEVTGPARTYNASIAAANELMSKGAINQTDYQKAIVQASRAYKEATDPLFQLKEDMDKNTIAAKLYGSAVDENNYYEQIRQAYLAKNIELSPTYVKGVNAEVDALMNKNKALLQQQKIQSTVGGIVNPLLEDAQMLQNKQLYYNELERLRQNDLGHEKIYQQAKYALDEKFSEMRLNNLEQTFGQIASLSRSKNKELAAIGKAAAVAQATIDGFLAVQKALSSLPPPFNFVAAGLVAVATGANVAGILSTNVGSFKDGTDFVVQGNSGVDRNNINMNVSRGERVIVQTPAQQREAARKGDQPNVQVPLKIINVQSKEELLSHMAGKEGERIVLNHMKNNPSAVAAAAGARS